MFSKGESRKFVGFALVCIFLVLSSVSAIAQDTEEEGKSYNINIFAKLGFIWLFPEPAEGDWTDFYFEPTINYGGGISYSFYPHMSAGMEILSANARLRVLPEDENVGFHTDVWFHDIRLFYRYDILTTFVRPWVSLGPSIAIIDIPREFERENTFGGNANAGCDVYLDDWIAVGASGGVNYYFPQNDFKSIHSYNLLFSATVAF